MAARELHHSFGQLRACEIAAIEAMLYFGRPAQLGAELGPPHLVEIFDPIDYRPSQQISRFDRVVNPFARERVYESSGVAGERPRPLRVADLQTIPGRDMERGDHRSVKARARGRIARSRLEIARKLAIMRLDEVDQHGLQPGRSRFLKTAGDAVRDVVGARKEPQITAEFLQIFHL